MRVASFRQIPRTPSRIPKWAEVNLLRSSEAPSLSKRCEDFLRYHVESQEALRALGYLEAGVRLPSEKDVADRLLLSGERATLNDVDLVGYLNDRPGDKNCWEFEEAQPTNPSLAWCLFNWRLFWNREISQGTMRFGGDMEHSLQTWSEKYQVILMKGLTRARNLACLSGAESLFSGSLLAERFPQTQVWQFFHDKWDQDVLTDVRRDLGLPEVPNLIPSIVNWQAERWKFEVAIDWVLVQEDPKFLDDERIAINISDTIQWLQPKGVYWQFRNPGDLIQATKHPIFQKIRPWFKHHRMLITRLPPNWLFPLTLKQLQIGPWFYSGFLAYND